MHIKWLIISLFVLSACTDGTVTREELKVINTKYCLVKNNKPFTGKVIRQFDFGGIAAITQFKNGVPDGEWTAYGQDGEVVQKGNYQPIDVSREKLFEKNKFIRFNIRNTNEVGFEFTNVLVVTAEPDQIDILQFKNLISSFLKNRSIKLNGDSIYKIRLVKAEWE